MNRHNLLIVDDEKDILRTLTLTFEEDYEVFTARSGIEALGVLERQDIALIIADQRMPEMTGVELLQKAITIKPQAIRIILTGYTDTEALIQAINKGHIYQYITKPWDRQELKILIRRALDSYDLCIENQRLLKELQAANDRLRDENVYIRKELRRDLKFNDIVGESHTMRRVFDLVGKVINTPVTVLLTGETGTEKRCWPGISTTTDRARTNCSWSRIAGLCRSRFWKASFSGTREARLPAPSKTRKDCLKPLMEERFFWMKSAK